MNTSRIGTDYERAYRHHIEKAGYLVTRAAASKGPWDLIAMGTNICWHIQLKAGKMSCPAADRLAAVLKRNYLWPSTCAPIVVHKLDRERFCEHVG